MSSNNNPSNAPFNASQYVDLSEVSDPRLKAEMTRMFDYWGTTPEGQKQLQTTAQSTGGPTKFTSNPDQNTGYSQLTNTININAPDLAHSNYFTTPDHDPSKTAPFTLPDTVWHEMTHPAQNGQPRSDALKQASSASDDIKRELVSAGEKEYAGTQKDYPDSEAFNAAADHADERIGNEMSTYVKLRYAAEQQGNTVSLTDLSPDYQKQYADQYYQSMMAVEAEKSKEYEDPVIASTNDAMKKLYPNEPARYGHDSITDPTKTNPLNSGTLSPEQQALADQHEGVLPASTDNALPIGIAAPASPDNNQSVPIPFVPQASNNAAPAPGQPDYAAMLQGVDVSAMKSMQVDTSANQQVAAQNVPNVAQPQQSAGMAV